MNTAKKNNQKARSMQPERPLSDAFLPHVPIKSSRGEALIYASFIRDRELLLRKESTFGGGSPHTPLALIDKIAEGRTALCRLRNYGIFVPRFSYVIAGDQGTGEAHLYSVVERVTGKNVTDVRPVTSALFREVENVFTKFLSYLADARISGEPFWSDFNIHQFMYGTVAGDACPHCYLVDIEPYAGRFARVGSLSESSAMASRSYLMLLMRIFLDIKVFEGGSRRRTKMRRARNLLLCAAISIPRSPIYDEFRDDFIALLSDRTS